MYFEMCIDSFNVVTTVVYLLYIFIHIDSYDRSPRLRQARPWLGAIIKNPWLQTAFSRSKVDLYFSTDKHNSKYFGLGDDLVFIL